MFGMKLHSLGVLVALVPYVLGFPNLENFPEYRSLAGLSPEEIQAVLPQFSLNTQPGPEPLPPPMKYTGSKLVNDAAHPFMADRPGDMRGPCPGLNTLAAHGYINRTGITSPNEIITAVQEGFNLGYHFATFLTFSGFIVDGNVLTNKVSIGANTTVDGSPVTGIDTHGNFEGDVSITREDIYLGDNIHFNETAFQVLIDAAYFVGGGFITREAGALNRRLRAQTSIANNPTLGYETPRFVGATAETAFILGMFVHEQTPDSTKPLSLDAARDFFQLHRFPDGFRRRQDPFEFPKINALTQELIRMVGIRPGHNEGKNNYKVNPNDPATFCYFYQQQALSVPQRYHNPPPIVKVALERYLEVYYQTLGDPSCKRVFPFGR